MRQAVAFMRNNEIFRRLEKVTSVASLTPEELRSYEADVKNTRDTLNQIRTAEERGLEEGRAEGRVEGRAEGRAEEKMAMARKMKANGMPFGDILLYTGLTEEEVRLL